MKRVRRKKGKISVIGILGACIIIYFISIIYTQQIAIDKYNSELEMYETQINQNNSILEGLNKESEDTNTDAYIEKIAREELGLVKPYEKIFIDINK